jgi:multiple sugar transport system ATP-binding protein
VLAGARSAAGEQLVLGIRPEAARLTELGTPGALSLTVALVEELGADAYVYGTLDGDPPGERSWVVRCTGHASPRIGDRVGVTIDGGEAHLFDQQTGLRVTAAEPIPAR